MNFKPFKLVLFLLFALSFGVSAQSNILNIPKGKATTVGIYIKDLKTGEVIAEHNSTRAMTPASITKSITTATALNKLSPDFRFPTTVELIGYRRNNRWNGNLVIHSSADPSLGSKEMEQCDSCFTDSLVSILQQMGIEKISGSIVINQNLKDAGPVANWEHDDLLYSYGVGLYGFNYHNNYDSTGVWKNPAEKYSKFLSDKLQEVEIGVGNQLFDEVEDLDTALIFEYYSPTALEICESLMKRSDNLFAEGMLRALAPDSTRKHCLNIEKDFLNSIGIDAEQSILLDGSGLSRANRFSPQFIGTLLEYMANSDLADEYISTFPVAGVHGTLKRFLKKTELENRLALKTGSMRSVQCYAGYKLDEEGKPTHVVVMMVNGFFCPRRELNKQIENYFLKTFK